MSHTPLKQAGLAPDVSTQEDVDTAWDKFFGSGGDVSDLPVRDVIANSWERCLSQGVNPEQQAAPLLAYEDTLHSLKEKNYLLLQSAQPVLEQAQFFLRDLETILFLTDYQGLNLHIVGDHRTQYQANSIGLVPGSAWNELAAGSNAVGTAMETKKATQVHGEEHYCQGFKPWTCTAAVITDPYDNQMIGVIDLSGLCSIYDKFHVPLVAAWGSQIQANLAKKTAEQWSTILEHSNSNFGRFRNSGKLLFDPQGRLVSSSVNAGSALNALGISFDPEERTRLSFQRFGGDKIIYPHDQGEWVSEDWIEPIRYKDKILGFQLLVPTNTKNQRRQDIAAAELPLPTKSKFDPFNNIYGNSPSFKASADKARKAATTPLPVLILGDTGVGKEVFAQAIHDFSNHADGPFIDLNCGAFSKDLLTSELFGHVDGAFTGAKKGGMIGKIEAANGGTLFLDEIGEMPLEIQPLFLRVLQERKIYKVGDIKPTAVDFRLVAATNLDLKKAVNEGRFRKDLFFRLSTVTISLDPLSGRKEDVEGIATLVLERVSRSHAITPTRIAPELIAALKNREWPGNIRELVNVVECMCFMSDNETLTVDDLPDGYRLDESSDNIIESLSSPMDINQSVCSLEYAEKRTIEAAIKQSAGNMTQATKLLCIAKSTLYQKMKKYGIEK